MTGDHEVLALVVERTQTVGIQIGDDVGHREGGLTELGKRSRLVSGTHRST